MYNRADFEKQLFLHLSLELVGLITSTYILISFTQGYKREYLKKIRRYKQSEFFFLIRHQQLYMRAAFD